MDLFSQGFVEILAAEQTPDNPNWYQGTADAVRQAARHFIRYDADYYLILAGDHLYRMDYSEMVDAHCDSRADITIAAQPVSIEEAPAMGIFRFDRGGQIVAFEEKPKRDRLREIGQSIPPGATFARALARQAVRRLDGRLCVLARRAARRASTRRAPPTSAARSSPRRSAVPGERVPVSRLLGRRRHGGIVLRRQHHADSARRAVQVLRSAAADLHACPVSARARASATAACRDAVVAEGCYLDRATIEESIVGIRTSIQSGRDDPKIRAARRRLLRSGRRRAGARRRSAHRHRPRRDARSSDRRQERAHRRRRPLVNEAGIERADGDGYYIRDGSSSCRKTGWSARGRAREADRTHRLGLLTRR